MASSRKTNPHHDKLQKKLELLGTRFSEFEFLTKLSDEDFVRIETAGEIMLDAEHRASIRLHLNEFEYFQRLAGKSYGETFLSVLERLETDLNEIISIAETLDRLPGHLWSYIADNADDAQSDLVRLKANRDRLTELNAFVDGAQERRTAYPSLYRLLTDLERVFKAAGGGNTKISRKEADKRGGPFIRFADAAILALPAAFRPEKSISARWERILSKKKKATPSKRRTWVGRPHPLMTKT